jgi:hypothetical protein
MVKIAALGPEWGRAGRARMGRRTIPLLVFLNSAILRMCRRAGVVPLLIADADLTTVPRIQSANTSY